MGIDTPPVPVPAALEAAGVVAVVSDAVARASEDSEVSSVLLVVG